MTRRSIAITDDPEDFFIHSVFEKNAVQATTLLRTRKGEEIAITQSNTDKSEDRALFIKSFLNEYRKLPKSFQWSPEITFAALQNTEKLCQSYKVQNEMILEAERIAIADKKKAEYWLQIYRWGYFVIFMGLVAFACLK